MAEHRIIERAEWDPLYRGGWPWYAGEKPYRPMPASEAWAHYPGGGNIPPAAATFEQDRQFVIFLDRVGYVRFGPSTGTGWGEDEKGPYGAGISYSLIITKAGRIFRGHDPGRQSSHTAGHNVQGMGYCFLVAVGDDLTDAQVEAAAWVLREQVRLGELQHARLDGGHRDVYPTICPTDKVMAAIPRINTLAAGGSMSLPRNAGTPAGIAALERAIRTQRPEWDITCGPSMAGRQCIRGKHGHLWDPKNGKVSTHYVDAAGGWTGTHVGGALDLSQDPAPGVPISDYEKVRADDLVRELDALGYGCIWGVTNHFDHPHVDYLRANRNIVYQGPNAGFTVPQIEAFQRAARTLGAYGGEVDGVRGPQTQAAIKQLQKLLGLAVDGLPGDETMAAINALLVLNAGFTLAQVRGVQRDLTKLGYGPLTVDGQRGAATQAAVRAFQKDARITVDGLPGEGTRRAIARALTLPEWPEPTPAPTPDPRPKPAPTPTPGRLAGADRFETAALVARQAQLERVPGKVYLAAGWSDTAAAAAAGDGVVLLAREGGNVLPGTTDAALRDLPVTQLVIVGGTAAIPEPQARQAADAANRK